MEKVERRRFEGGVTVVARDSERASLAVALCANTVSLLRAVHLGYEQLRPAPAGALKYSSFMVDCWSMAIRLISVVGLFPATSLNLVTSCGSFYISGFSILTVMLFINKVCFISSFCFSFVPHSGRACLVPSLRGSVRYVSSVHITYRFLVHKVEEVPSLLLVC